MTDIAELVKDVATCVCHTPGLRGRIVAALHSQAKEIAELQEVAVTAEMHLSKYEEDVSELEEANERLEHSIVIMSNANTAEIDRLRLDVARLEGEVATARGCIKLYSLGASGTALALEALAKLGGG